MTAVFLKLLNMSIAASWLVLAVIVLRLFLKKAPSWIVCLLWGIVALRLVMPFTFESAFSLIPSPEVIPMDVTISEAPAIHSGIPVVNSMVNPIVTQSFASARNGIDVLLHYGSVIWLVGTVLMLIYSVATYWKLQRQVAVSMRYRENIYFCDHVESPFLLGIFRPRIYLPSDLPEEQQRFVLAHENAHIKRRDHWWKPFGFLLLTLYWFNPLLWVGYILLCRDIERACDEKVITRMDPAGKIGYSEALVACSVHRRMVMACPVAFGEVSVKSRIKGVLNYKKPVFWVVCVSMLICVITAACFLTNPQTCLHAYEGSITTEPTCTKTGLRTEVCSHCQHSYTVLVERTAHHYDTVITTEPASCTHSGILIMACADCGDQQTQSLEKTAHVPGDVVFVTEPNCTHEGARSTTCAQCNTMYVLQVLPTNHDHDLQEIVIKEATCDGPGEGVLQCSRCDYSESVTYPQADHTLIVESSREAKCNSFGSITRVCTVCGDLFVEDLGIGDHNWQYYNSSSKKCSYCGWIVPSSDYSLFDDSFSTGFTGSGTSPSITPSLPVVRWDPGPVTQWGTLSW